MEDSAAPLLKAMAWFSALGYAPTRPEYWLWVRGTRDDRQLDELIQAGRLREAQGRLFLPGDERLLDERDARERAFPRKWRKMRRMARMLAWVPSVRFFAIGNTTALGLPRDEADIDVFCVVKEGTLWTTRLLLVGLAWLFGRRPGARFGERDAWCFSFFLDDTNLSLERFALPEGDPYLAHWVIRLLPLFDDGIGQELWRANAWAWRDRAMVAPWISWKRGASRSQRVPRAMRWLDRRLGAWQRRWGSKELAKRAAAGGTDVVMDDHVCKLHLDDRRAWYRTQYEQRLASVVLSQDT